MTILILAAAMWFGLQALLAYLQTASPGSRLVVFVYCFVCMLILLYCDGYFPGHVAPAN